MASALSSQLRLFTPDNSFPLPADMRLRQAFELVAKPSFLTATKSTIAEYVAAVKRWEEFTDDLPITEIDDAACDSFTQAVLDSECVRNTTYNKWARHLRGIFNRLGPRDSRNKLGKNIMPQIPIIQMLNEDLTDPIAIPLDHISRMYEACDVARWPNRSGVSAPLRWRCLLATLYNVGPRRDDALLFTQDSIFRDPSNGQLYLRWVARKTRKKQKVPLNAVMRSHLSLLPNDGFTLFGMPTGNRRDFYATWRAICQAAQVPAYIPKDFRKTCSTQLDLQLEAAAGWVLGHSNTVTRKFYTNPSEKVTKAINAMAQPEAFLRILQGGVTPHE